MLKQEHAKQGRPLKVGKVRKGPFGVRAKHPKLLARLWKASEGRLRKRAARQGR